MGYCIYHSKFSQERPQNGWGIELSKTSFSDSDRRLFAKYFQKVTTRQHIDSITLCPSEHVLQSEKQRLHQNNGVFLVNDEKAIEKYVNHKRYHLLEKETTSLYDNRTVIDFYEYETVDGFYLKEVFQHPFNDGANQFYTKYNPGEYYSELKVFEEACDLQFEEYRFGGFDDFQNEKREFVKYLVDQYEYGSSILYYL